MGNLARMGGLLGVLLCTAHAAAAGGFGASFSAEMVQNAPQQPPMQGRMYVGDGRIRTELSAQGQLSVQIVDPNAGKLWMLLPDHKLYMEMPVPPAASMKGSAGKSSPCEGIPGMTCQRMGEETVNGRAAVRWLATANRDGRPLQGAIWTDAAHGFPVKEQIEGQVVSELRFIGQESVNGRTAEKWIASTSARGQSVQTVQWYDPQLNIAIRQEMPGGYVRELRNIQIGAQPDALFRLPADYRKVESPLPDAMTGPR